MCLEHSYLQIQLRFLPPKTKRKQIEKKTSYEGEGGVLHWGAVTSMGAVTSITVSERGMPFT